jgi:hypothetical protein
VSFNKKKLVHALGTSTIGSQSCPNFSLLKGEGGLQRLNYLVSFGFIATVPKLRSLWLDVIEFFNRVELQICKYRIIHKNLDLRKRGRDSVHGVQIVSQGLELVSQGLEIVSQGLELVSQGLELVSQGFELVSQGLEIVSQGLEIVSQGLELVSQGPESVSQGLELKKNITMSFPSHRTL